jgi:N-carbamoyl-L-amino-acid hydrolase
MPGVSVGEALNAIGYAGPRAVLGHPVGAYFEAHIEQGPILEDQAKTIGVVLGALGQKWFDLTCAVSRRMPARRRCTCAGRPGRRRRGGGGGQPHRPRHQPHACGTVGCLQAYPGSRNVIPGEVRMTLDFRHLEGEQLDAMIAEVRGVIEATGQAWTEL